MRLADWQARLAEFVVARARVKFSWGAHDCCTFAAGAVEAITGANPMVSVPYDSEIGAVRRISRAGGLRALTSQFLGPSVAPVFAAVGDVVLVMNEGREALALCNGTSAIGPGPDSCLVSIDMSAALFAWKI